MTFVAGGPGKLNLNPGVAARSDRITLGATVLAPGHREPLHALPTDASYVVARGAADVRGHEQIATLGHLDALFVPAGVEHGLAAAGDDPLYVVWLHHEQTDFTP